MRFMYCPVSTHRNHKLNRYHPHCLYNPVRQMPDLQQLNGESEYFADCGGFQLWRYNGSGTKRCLVVPRAGIKNTKELLVIDQLELCKRYDIMGVKYGFTLDQPLSDEPSDAEFYRSLEDGYRWAGLMLEHKPSLCSKTELLIPLHFETKKQLQVCYDQMSTLSPHGYAFAVRGDFVDLTWIFRVALTLAFLYSKNVKKVHMFGSSRREVIVIGAAAIGLEMFEQLSFDSRNWNTRFWNGPNLEGSKYFDPDSDKWRFVGNEPPDIFVYDYMLQDGKLPQPANEQDSLELLMLQNATAISYRAACMATMAQDLNGYRQYISNYFGGRAISMLLLAIQILEDSVRKDYSFVEKWTQCYW